LARDSASWCPASRSDAHVLLYAHEPEVCVAVR
jgi:hypothetical protein